MHAATYLESCSTLRMTCFCLELSGRSHRDGGTSICTPELVLFAFALHFFKLIPSCPGELMTLAGQEVLEDPSRQCVAIVRKDRTCIKQNTQKISKDSMSAT